MSDPNNPYPPGYGPHGGHSGYPGYPPPAPPPQYGYSVPPLASWGIRVAAGAVDLVIFMVPWIVLLGVLGFVLALGADSPDPARAAGAFAGRLNWLGCPLFWVFFGLMDAQQGTPGKRLFKLRVLRAVDAQPVSPGLGVGRKCLWALNSVCCLGFLWPLWDGRNQTLGDKMVDTVVVRYG